MIISVDDIKAIAAIQIDTNDYSQDEFLESICLDVTGEIEGIIGQPVEQVTITYEFKGNDLFVHSTKYTKGTEFTALQFRAIPTDAWADVTGDFVLSRSENTAQLYYSDGFIGGYGYKATLKVGWASIPAVITAVAREMAVVRYWEFGGGDAQQRKIGMSSVVVNGPGGTTTNSYLDMSPKWAEKLEPFKVVVV